MSRTTLLNLKRDGRICNLPLYAVTLFSQLAASGGVPGKLVQDGGG